MLSGIWSNFCNNSNDHCIAVTIEYELIMETFQTTSEQTMQIFFTLTLETFIQKVHNLCNAESIQFWKHFKQPVSFYCFSLVISRMIQNKCYTALSTPYQLWIFRKQYWGVKWNCNLPEESGVNCHASKQKINVTCKYAKWHIEECE